MTVQINIRIEEDILNEIDEQVEDDIFIKNRTEFIRRAIEERLLREQRLKELRLIEEKDS